MLNKLHNVELRTVLAIVAFCIELNEAADETERFSEQPADSTVVQGARVLLRCTVEHRAGAVQWLRNGFGLGLGPVLAGYPRYRVLANPGTGEYHLEIADAQLEDDAGFQCQVGATSSTLGLRSREATLTLLVPPASVEIDGAPLLSVTAHRPHNLTCRSRGGKPPSVLTWHSPPGAPSNPAEAHSEAGELGDWVGGGGAGGWKPREVTSRHLVVPEKTDEGKEWECRAWNRALNASLSTSVKLEVHYVPEISMSMIPAGDTKEFDRVEFRCLATAKPEVTSWRWFIGEDELVGKSDSTLLFPSISRRLNKQNVTCETSNSAGTTRSHVTLHVKYGPAFTSPPEDQAVDEGAPEIRLSCTAEGSPSPTVVWRRRGQAQVLGRGPSLDLGGVKGADFGTYTCTASAAGFDDVSRDVRLLRNGPPTIVSTTEQFAFLGMAGVIECIVEAVPRPTVITWSKDDQPISFEPGSRYALREEEMQDGRRSLLEIGSVQKEDFSEYNCSTDNGYGFVQMQIRLIKGVMMPLPYILAGACSALLLIIIVSVVACVCCRRKSNKSGSSSDGSECSITKKNGGLPDGKVGYSNGVAPKSGMFYDDEVADAWKADKVDATGSLPLNRGRSRYVITPEPWLIPGYAPSGYEGVHAYSPVQGQPSTAYFYGTYPRSPPQKHAPLPNTRASPVSPYGSLPRTRTVPQQQQRRQQPTIRPYYASLPRAEIPHLHQIPHRSYGARRPTNVRLLDAAPPRYHGGRKTPLSKISEESTSRPYTPRPPPASPTTSRLYTNV